MTVRLSSAEAIDFAALVRPGETVLVGEGAGEPTSLAQALVAQRHSLTDIRIFLGMHFSRSFRPEHADSLRFASYGALGDARRLADAGHLDLVPVGLGQFPGLIARGALKFDVVVIAVPPIGADGRYSLGLTAMVLPHAIKAARLVIAEVNPSLPAPPGVTIAPEDIDLFVETDRPPPELPAPPVTDTVRRIARNAAAFVEDGSTLQLGVGAVPDAICTELEDRRDLGIHSGLLSSGLGRLIDRGVVTGALYRLHPGKAVIGSVMGDAALYEFARGNEGLRLEGIETTHGRAAEVDSLVAINGALEVDLAGQVNGEIAGGRYIGAIGGQAEFARAAARAPHGRSVIVLSATSPDGARSNIVAGALPRVTTPRADVDVVVTEYGAAELTGCGDRERRRRLIAIADPKFRDALEAAEVPKHG